jgi:hypothetical protein
MTLFAASFRLSVYYSNDVSQKLGSLRYQPCVSDPRRCRTGYARRGQQGVLTAQAVPASKRATRLPLENPRGTLGGLEGVAGVRSTRAGYAAVWT